MIKNTVVQETKTVWVVHTNTDLTEGRGYEYIMCVCETEATARRKGERGYVMGSPCPITEQVAVKVDEKWFIPGNIQSASKEDRIAQTRIDAQRATLEKARAAGLSDEEIRILSGK